MKQQQGRQRRTSAAALHFQGLVRPPPPQHPLKCPRCDSLNTKFCYYNNYRLSQPRHLCKRCRRYWTQGGTCRNIPVGGSRSKKNCSKATDVAKDPTIIMSSSTVSVEMSLLSNVCPVPAVTTSRSSAMPSQPAGGSMLPSYSYANDGLLSSVIAKPQSLNYSQDTFSSQPVINSQLFDVVNSFRTSLGFSQGFDAVSPMVSSLNNYDQQLQPTQSFHQDMYGMSAMNTSKEENWSGGLGGSLVNPNNDLSYTNIPGHGYPSNNFWQMFKEKQHHNT